MGKRDLGKDLEEFGVGRVEDAPVRGYLSTGNLAFDWAISGKLVGGGYPEGRVIEVYGDPSTGKSLLAMHAMANALKAGWVVLYDDAEASLDKFFAAKIGLDVGHENFYYTNSETIEGHFQRISRVIQKIREKEDTPIMIVLDSLAVLSTTHERGKPEVLSGEQDQEIPTVNMEKRDMTKAQLIRSALRVLGSRFTKDNVTYICLNHATSTIGVMYGPKTTTPGGGGIKFAAAVRIDVNKGKAHRNADEETGHTISVSITKNKVAPPHKRAMFDFFYETGLKQYSGYLEILKMYNLVTESGGYVKCTLLGDKNYRSDVLEGMIPELLPQIEKAVKDAREKQEVTSPSEKQ